uniref:Uncharacterized protein n=1 Tax=Pipistrellus kuhlii TaxID=59472 RepID=A0A7J7RGA0_PIPKU|nr:hypothetical protein mPipKuh1_010553 [Pipistrellus kuhlii]
MNFPYIGRAKRYWTLRHTARFNKAKTNSKIGAGAKKRSHPPRTSLAEWSEQRGNALSLAPASDLKQLNPSVLSSLGAWGLDLCQAASNPWRPGPCHRALERTLCQEVRLVPRALLLGLSLLALPSRPTYWTLLSQHLLDVEVVGVRNSA